MDWSLLMKSLTLETDSEAWGKIIYIQTMWISLSSGIPQLRYLKISQKYLKLSQNNLNTDNVDFLIGDSTKVTWNISKYFTHRQGVYLLIGDSAIKISLLIYLISSKRTKKTKQNQRDKKRQWSCGQNNLHTGNVELLIQDFTASRYHPPIWSFRRSG